MNRIRFWQSLVACTACVLPCIAAAQQAVLVGDTMVVSTSPSRQFGSSQALNIRRDSTVLLRFDVNGAVPSGTTATQVQRARLIIFPNLVSTPGVIQAYKVTGNWSEGIVSYLTRPTVDQTALASATAHASQQYIQLDVTDLVRTWLKDPTTNLGLELTTILADISIDSKENAATSHPAILSIDLAGRTGPQGLQGVTGPQGPRGPQGPTGPQGPKGSDGTLTLPYAGEAFSDDVPGFTIYQNGLAQAAAFYGGPATSASLGKIGGAGIFTSGGDSDLNQGAGTTGGAGIEAYGGSNPGVTSNGGYGGMFFGGPAGMSGGTAGTGIYATSLQGPTAAVLDGNVEVTANLSKSSGSFKIDDPIDPEDKYLYHSFVESPDMMNVYNGNVVTDGSGVAIVTMPEWFEALNRDYRYQLTVIGQFAQAIVAREVTDGRFTIKTDKPNVKVSWQVTGIRQDAWANAHRIPVEEEKSESDKGHYIHPELFGHAGEPSISQIHNPRPSSPPL